MSHLWHTFVRRQQKKQSSQRRANIKTRPSVACDIHILFTAFAFIYVTNTCSNSPARFLLPEPSMPITGEFFLFIHLKISDRIHLFPQHISKYLTFFLINLSMKFQLFAHEIVMKIFGIVIFLFIEHGKKYK